VSAHATMSCDEDRHRTQEARAWLAKVRSQLGFEHFNFINVLDLTYTTLDDAVKQLGEQVNLYR
jgi:hypothetical protein